MVLGMKLSLPAWLIRPPKRWIHLQHVPLRQLRVLLLAVFLLFSVLGFQEDLMGGGMTAYLVVLANAVVSGLIAVIWVFLLARMRTYWLLCLIAVQMLAPKLERWNAAWLVQTFHLSPVSPSAGMQFAAIAILIAVISSYSVLSTYMAITGKEVYRLKTELDLAHSIQKTLVPPVEKLTRCFEIYGVSEPSEKVGGDLVDVVELEGGDIVAYLADIAGHGLQAGILMGMLKTAARTALTDGAFQPGAAALSMLMQRLNVILPQVKEAHMYATFTALRLNADGETFYGMAASPPLLHWGAADHSMTHVEEEQFPLGLLPVAEFGARAFSMKAGDLVLVATDGILEVSSVHGVEFGAETLEAVVAANASLPLPELAAAILRAVRAYGKQFDDQTLLLVRRNPA
jgi:serine phosphatase RsbU (regulator of sigma subunit)